MKTSRLLSNRPLTLPLGAIIGQQRKPFVLSEDRLATHLGVFGSSGFGKSKFLELLCRTLMDNYRGFCFIDPHGDTVEDLLAYAASQAEKYQTDAICKRIHYLEPTFAKVFAFDPFEFRPTTDIPEHLKENAYHAWLHAKVDKVSEVVQRKQGQGDFQGMARLQRVLRDVLVAVATAVTPDGKHLPLSDVLVLLDTHHRRHADVVGLVLNHLPPDIRGDFASLQACRSEEQRKKETESTINRLRSLLSPIVKEIFAPHSETIDFRDIMLNRGIVLVNLRKTDYFSADQRNAIGGLLIHEILSTAETTAREHRTPYYLIVDEARLFAGQDLLESLNEARKFKLSVCLAGQYLGQFKTDEFDMTPGILNNCGTLVSFRQNDPDDLETWKKFFGYPNLNFAKHFQVMDRQRGHDFLDVEDWSETENGGWNAGAGGSFTESDGTSHVENRGTAHQVGCSETESEQTMHAVSESDSRGLNTSQGSSLQLSPVFIHGIQMGYHNSLGDNQTEGRTHQTTQGESRGQARGQSVGQSESWTTNEGTADGTTHGQTRGISWNHGISGSEGETINHKKIPVPHLVEEWFETPHLRNAVSDQLDRFAQIQRVLPKRYAAVSLADERRSLYVRIGDVEPVSSGPKDFADKLDAMKSKIFATHPYYSTPDLAPAQQDRKLNEFLANVDKESNRIEGPDQAPPDAEKNSGFVL
jgi:hypothetical protein